MDVWFCIGRNLRREAQIALEGILIKSNARSPKRAQETRAFRLTLTYMEVWFCIGRNLRREAQIALKGILIRSNARSPKRAGNSCFCA